MAKFAKLIELGEEQVLLTVNYNDDDDKCEVAIRTDIGSLVVEITLNFDTEEKAYESIETYSQEKAAKFRAEMEAMLS